MTTAETIEAVATDLGLTMTTEFVPWSRSRNAAEKHPSLNWKVTLHRTDWLPGGKTGKRYDILTTDYMAGPGHCPSYRQGDNGVMGAECVRHECETGKPVFWSPNVGAVSSSGRKPILPVLADVLQAEAAREGEVELHGG